MASWAASSPSHPQQEEATLDPASQGHLGQVRSPACCQPLRAGTEALGIFCGEDAREQTHAFRTGSSSVS